MKDKKKTFKFLIKLTKKRIVIKNFYTLFYELTDHKSPTLVRAVPAIRYDLRLAYYHKLIEFFKFNSLNMSLVLRIFYREFQYF